MSVTFTAELSAIVAWAFTCGVHDNGVTEHRFGSHADAEAFLKAELDAHGCTGHLAVCGDQYCKTDRMFAHGIEEAPSPELNVSKWNAPVLLGLIGITADDDDELVGSMDAEQFLGAVMMAQAINPADAGVPATEARSEGGLRVIDCGRREGWSDDRLDALREIAEFAVATGRKVQWG
jgi:hypothetical protein